MRADLHFERPCSADRPTDEGGATTEHTRDLTCGDGPDGSTTVRLHVAITAIDPKAEMAASGTRWGDTAQLDALAELLS